MRKESLLVMGARRRRRVSSAAERWLWLRWGRGCSRASARPSRDQAEIQQRDSGDTVHSLRRSPSSGLALSPKTLPRHFPLEGPPASKAPRAPFRRHFPGTSKTPPLASLHISLRRDPLRRHLLPPCRRGHPGKLSRPRVRGAAGGPRERSVRADTLKGGAEPQSQKNALRES